jgi:hypothetical protein
MRGIVKIDEGTFLLEPGRGEPPDDEARESCVHIIPRAEVRYVEVTKLAGYSDAWVLDYQLVGMPVRSIRWQCDCRPPSLKRDATITTDEYNRIAAESVQAVITRGHRDVHLERRSDGVVLVRSGMIENDAQVVLCRKFIAEMALTARQTAIGPLDDTRLHMLHEIHAAARDLVLPAWFPLQEDRSTEPSSTNTKP